MTKQQFPAAPGIPSNNTTLAGRDGEQTEIKMKKMLANRRQGLSKRVTSIEGSTTDTERAGAEYWKDWEKLGQFDEMSGGTTEVLRDKNGGIHLLKTKVTVDGKALPKDICSPFHYFDKLGVPYDHNRVGRVYVDRKISLKKALEIWIPHAIPTDLEKFLKSLGIDLAGLASR